MHRREFLTSSPAFLGLSWGPLADNEGPETNDLEYDSEGIPKFPDHITDVRDDLSELENYQPRLVTQTQQARSDMVGMYGWSADSENHDVTAHYYWVKSNTQRSVFYTFGVGNLGPERHFEDHEPIIVFENPDGTVDKVVCSGGHHLSLVIDGEYGHLIEDRVPDRRTHVVLRQVRPHNHFMEAESTEDGGYVQGYAEFASWLDVRDRWYRNDHFEKTSDVAVMDPFSFYPPPPDGRTYWWREGTWDAWAARNLRIRTLAIGNERDTLRYEEV